jgi:hypothetical protein
MPANFLDLPRELRDQIYELALMDQDYTDLGTWYYPRSFIPELLRTNKTVYREATPLLYTHNRFNFITCDSVFVASFLNRIGRENVKHIRHIRIDFPSMHNLD